MLLMPVGNPLLLPTASKTHAYVVNMQLTMMQTPIGTTQLHHPIRVHSRQQPHPGADTALVQPVASHEWYAIHKQLSAHQHTHENML